MRILHQGMAIRWTTTTYITLLVSILTVSDNWKSKSARATLTGTTDESNNSPGEHVHPELERPYISSDTTFHMIREWLRNCSVSHTECTLSINEAQSDCNTRASRFLRLTEHGNVKISQPRDPVDYIALSYCWGDNHSMKLSRESLSAWTQSISVEDLPKTVQDVIYLARQLNISYIWVDRLCIIQDDETDITREISKMSDIYRGAYLTVSASMARSCSDGFLHFNPATHPLMKSLFSVQYLYPDGILGLVTLGRIGRDCVNTYTEIVDARAWTLQEQLLSVRFLDFCSHTLAWRCEIKRDFNGNSVSRDRFPLLESWRSEDMHYGEFIMTDHAGKQPIVQQDEKISHAWSEIVRKYTDRNLSYNSDKLRAISAIAREFSRRLEKAGLGLSPQYIAGMWRHDLPASLMWYVSQRDSTWEIHPRPRHARAPSWSWASVDGRIEHFDRLGNFNVKIHDCFTTLVSSVDPFSDMSEARLEVRGRVCMGIWNLDKNSISAKTTSDMDEQRKLRMQFDATEDFGLSEHDFELEVHCLELGNNKSGGNSTPFGLILLLVEGITFRRIGCFFGQLFWDADEKRVAYPMLAVSREWFDGCIYQDMILI